MPLQQSQNITAKSLISLRPRGGNRLELSNSGVQQRLSELLADDESTMEQLVFFAIPEPGDTLQQLVNAIGTDLLTVDG